MKLKFKMGDVVLDVWGYSRLLNRGTVIDFEALPDGTALYHVKFEDENKPWIFYQKNLILEYEYYYQDFLERIKDRIK